jgi:hypothetical protein
MTHAKVDSRRAIRPAGRARNCGAVLALLAAAIVHADSEDEIARCARIPSVGDRIICLEDALRRADDPHASMPTEAPGNGANTSASDTGTGTGDETARAATERASEGAPQAREAAEFGLDESQKQAESLESIRVTVVAIDKNAYGKLRYITGDGQVWQQIDQRTPRYPDVPFPAEIRSAAAGSFFLQPLSSGVAVRVQRKR